MVPCKLKGFKYAFSCSMKIYRCDNCKREQDSKMLIYLKGYRPSHLWNIILPEQHVKQNSLMKHHFCCVKCFKQWLSG